MARKPRIEFEDAFYLLIIRELVVRFGANLPFETDMFVAQQRKAIVKYADWVKANSNRFRDGEWDFAGRIMER